jgi:hypothetical protein
MSYRRAPTGALAKRRDGYRVALENVIGAVLLILVVIAAVGIVSVYVFGKIGSHTSKFGVKIVDASIQGGVATITVQNTGLQNENVTVIAYLKGHGSNSTLGSITNLLPGKSETVINDSTGFNAGDEIVVLAVAEVNGLNVATDEQTVYAT